MWPPTWYNQFDYQGIDPFTSSQYSQWQGDNVFENAIGSDHMDWVSWVNTFSVNACYTSTDFGIYKPAAMEKWNAWKNYSGMVLVLVLLWQMHLHLVTENNSKLNIQTSRLL